MPDGARNRAVKGIELNSGHSYDGILHDNRAAFARIPSTWDSSAGSRSTKFCISNPGLRKLVVEYELKRFEKNPTLDSVSLDPSDGGDWCECGTPESWAPLQTAPVLANEVALAVNREYPGKFVGMYAYNYHSPPPNLRADPHVVVSVATAFIRRAERSTSCSVAGRPRPNGSASANTTRLAPGTADMPGQARGGNIDYLRRTISEFYRKGVRFLSAESGDSWGPYGSGLLPGAAGIWDVHEPDHVDRLVDDFADPRFGPAKEPMREFYGQLDGSKPHLVPSDQLGRMFRCLDQAPAGRHFGGPCPARRSHPLRPLCRPVHPLFQGQVHRTAGGF